jgi:hypothetical protein
MLRMYSSGKSLLMETNLESRRCSSCNKIYYEHKDVENDICVVCESVSKKLDKSNHGQTTPKEDK